MIDNVTVAVDNEIRKVPILTVDHLRVFRLIEKGATKAELADNKHIINDLIALGWVMTSADRH